MKAFKGFNKDLKCRDFQFEIGKEYEEETASLCNSGFHACEYPLDCFNYYKPANSRFCEVELEATDERNSEDSKVCGKRIKIGAEIGIPGLVKAAIEYITEKATPSNKHHTTAKHKANSATGYGSANSATGDWSANSATGSRSANSATGYGSANISTGFDCSNSGEGERNICVGWGKNNKCKGSIGSFLVLSEWGDFDGEKYPFIGAVMVTVDGEKIKADTWYSLINGEFKEVESEETNND